MLKQIRNNTILLKNLLWFLCLDIFHEKDHVISSQSYDKPFVWDFESSGLNTFV